MDRLHFGARARRRALLQRLAVWLWVASVLGAAAGLPGLSGGGLLERLAARGALLERAGAAVPVSRSAAAAVRFRRGVFESRPRPTPSPSAGAASLTGILAAAAHEFGLDPGYLIAVAHCESTLDPNAVNPAGYYGLFQFDDGTWAAYGYGSIFDPVAQARTAARLLAAGQASRWPSCA